MAKLSFRWILALAAVVAIFGAGSWWILAGQAPAPAHAGSDGPTVVVAELFTSEGCSSCPPADEILSGLLHRQQLEGITVLGLSEHVDYWNRDGWVDPFSSAEFTKRQLDYRRAFHKNVVYTPQLVVDGHMEHFGNDANGVYRTIILASVDHKAKVNVTASAEAAASTVRVGIKAILPAEIALSDKVDVVVAITEDDLAADVRGGENGGRHLKHSGVVRKLITVGTVTPLARDWSGSASIALAPDWKPANLKVIGLLQEQESRRILGAGWSQVEGLTAAR